MATRYLTALDYSDWHANSVLKKHAKKRPLGDLEVRYQYTPPQPVLSCRTVDIDLSGTRTYRPKSTTDILNEQQKLIHRLFRNGRSAASAPPRHSSAHKKVHLGQVSNGDSHSRTNIQIQGRPYTSMSHTWDNNIKHKSSSKSRPKTTGRLNKIKPVTESFMKMAVDEDMLETRRSYNELTNQIHAHWKPDRSNLNQGHFMRGKKRPDDVPPTLDAWLTFGGTGDGAGGGSEKGGVVDAFASFSSPEDYYNIEGSVGSRVAQQLQKGDKIRIGINGQVHSHDLKVKKWLKDEQEVKAQGEEKNEEMREERIRTSSAKEKPSSSPTEDKGEDLFGDIMFDTLEDDLVKVEEEVAKKSEEASRPKSVVPSDPVNLDDLMARPDVKVISPRRTPRDDNRENLCESHPVLYDTIVRTTQPRPKLARSQTYMENSQNATNGYRFKQRPLGSNQHPAMKGDHPHRLDSASGSKVKALSCDPNSAEEEQRLNSMSVDDVVQMRLEKSASSPTLGVTPGRNVTSRGGAREGREGSQNTTENSTAASTKQEHPRMSSHSGRSQGRTSSAVSKASQDGDWGSGRGNARPAAVLRPSSSVPIPGQRDVDLSLVTPATIHVSRTGGSGRHDRMVTDKGGRGLGVGKAMAIHNRGFGSGGVSSINTGPIPGDTEFIQISQPIRNPSYAQTRGIGGGAGGLRSTYAPYQMNSMASTPVPQFSSPRSITPDNGMVVTPRILTPVNPNASLGAKMNFAADANNSSNPPTTPEPEYNKDINGGNLPEDARNSALSPASEPCASLVPSSSSSLPVNVKAISIPTAGRLEEEEEEEMTVAQRRERTLRDEQINQITDLLAGAIVGGSK